MRVSVRQHIFANVPKEQSPRGRRGFQTLYASPGLTAEQTLLLEERAQYQSGPAQRVKHQFYVLGDGQVVVTQIVTVAEPDEYGRPGRYLAHSLILAAADFRRLAYCPLGLLSPRHFIAEMGAAVAAGDRATGGLSPTTLDVPDPDTWQAQALELARSWPPAELEALARLAWRAADLRAARQIVALEGPTEAALPAMNICFLLCPPQKRPALTFDTYTQGNDWSRDWPFWAWGGLEGSSPAPYRIDASARRVHGRLPEAGDSPFERWLARQAIPERLENLLAYEGDALQLAAILGGSAAGASDIAPEFGRQFAQINAADVARRVLSLFPAELGQTRRELLQRRVLGNPWVYLSRLPQGFTAPVQAAELTDVEMALVGSRSEPAEAELRALGELATAAGSHELHALLLLRSKDRDAWRRSLAQVSAGGYRRIVEAALSTGTVSLAEALVLEHLAVWAEIAARVIRPGELKGILRAIDRQDLAGDLDSLQGLWPALSREDQLLLVEWLRRYPGPAPRLRAALGVPLPEVAGERSLLGRLKRPFGRKSSETDDRG
jgi:hypothetical protein